MLFAASAGALEAADVEALASGGAGSPGDALVDVALAGDLAVLERAVTQGLRENAEAALAAGRLAQRVALLLDIRQGGGGEPERLQRLPFAVRRTVLGAGQRLGAGSFGAPAPGSAQSPGDEPPRTGAGARLDVSRAAFLCDGGATRQARRPAEAPPP